MISFSNILNEIQLLIEEGGWVFIALIALAGGIAFALLSIWNATRLPDAPHFKIERVVESLDVSWQSACSGLRTTHENTRKMPRPITASSGNWSAAVCQNGTSDTLCVYSH